MVGVPDELLLWEVGHLLSSGRPWPDPAPSLYAPTVKQRPQSIIQIPHALRHTPYSVLQRLYCLVDPSIEAVIPYCPSAQSIIVASERPEERGSAVDDKIRKSQPTQNRGANGEASDLCVQQ